MGAKNAIDDVEFVVVERLSQAVSERGLSVRTVGESIGVGKSRTNELLNGKTSCTVTDLARLCHLLGLSPAEVVREAEEAVARAEGPAVVEPAPAASSGAPEGGRVVPLRPGEMVDEDEPDWDQMAAKIHHGRAREIAERTGWREDLGEESQANPDWEE